MFMLLAILGFVGSGLYGYGQTALATWTNTTCFVEAVDCCHAKCGKSGCVYAPHWTVQWIVDAQGQTRTGSFYGVNYYSDQSDATNEEASYPVNSSFACQWDPTFADGYNYIIPTGQWVNQFSNYLWMVICWALCLGFLALVGISFIARVIHKGHCHVPSMNCHCCNRSSWKPQISRTRSNPIAPRAPLSASSQSVEVPVQDGSAGASDMKREVQFEEKKEEVEVAVESGDPPSRSASVSASESGRQSEPRVGDNDSTASRSSKEDSPPATTAGEVPSY